VSAENLGTLLAQAAQRFGFRELLSRAEAVRGALAHAGLAPHEPVHVRVSNQPGDLAAYLGVWLAGGVVVPVHRGSPEGAVSHILSRTRARFEWDRGLESMTEEAPPRRSILEGAALKAPCFRTVPLRESSLRSRACCASTPRIAPCSC
jgi:long-chain acyl-CoA synthetase